MSRARLNLGQKGERIAEKHLRKKGFRPVARNLRRKTGELDLVMWDGEELVVIEVRTVQRLGDFAPGDKVPVTKQKQIVRVAEALLAELPDPLPPVRIDVCVISLEPEIEIHHMIDAIRPWQLASGRT